MLSASGDYGLIRSTRNAATAEVLAGKRTRGLPPDIQIAALRKLLIMEAATTQTCARRRATALKL